MKPIAIRVRELCMLVGIGKTTAYRLIRENEVESFRIGRCTCVTLKSVCALLERKKAVSSPKNVVAIVQNPGEVA